MVPTPPRDERPRLVAFGNVAVGFIAIGNVAVGVVAIGFTVAVGPIAIGMNAAGILVGIGLNALGTLALAAINALGVTTFAGVNGLGVSASTLVNAGESAIVGLFLLCAQLAATIVLTRRLRAIPPEPRPFTVRLDELTSGTRDEGLVRARVVALSGETLTIEEDASPGRTRASLAITGEARASLREVRSTPGSAVLIGVRASKETSPATDTNYRVAPPITRILCATHLAPLPARPPFWARPGAIARTTRASLYAAAAITIFQVGMRLFG